MSAFSADNRRYLDGNGPGKVPRTLFTFAGSLSREGEDQSAPLLFNTTQDS